MQKKMLTSRTVREMSSIKFPLQSFDQDNLTPSINCLIYGQIINKFYSGKNNFHPRIFYILEDDFEVLQWISKKKKMENSRIYLNEIINITDDFKLDSKFKKFQTTEKNLLFIKYESEIEMKTKELVLKFETEEKKKLWWQGLQHFFVNLMHKKNKIRDQRKILAKKLFLKADKDGSKMLDFSEITILLQKLHIMISEKYMKQFFNKYDLDKNNLIDWSEFKMVIKEFTLKPELKKLYNKYKKKTKFENDDLGIGVEELKQFYEKEQKEIIDLSDLLYNMNIFKMTEEESKNELMRESLRKDCNFTFSDFCSLMFSKTNSIFSQKKQRDMNKPLNDYYINSSHNTYLLANQLTSESNTKAYINALAKGCRCLELDCWDGEKGVPIIYHGYTFTSKILFEDVINTINNYAFFSNPYPIILSIENHCSYEQQEKMGEIFEAVFKDRLFILPNNFNSYEKLPSPNDLKYKIIIKDRVHRNSLLNFETNLMNTENISSLREEADIDDLSDLLEEDNDYLEIKTNNFINYNQNMTDIINRIYKKSEVIKRSTEKSIEFRINGKTNDSKNKSKKSTLLSSIQQNSLNSPKSPKTFQKKTIISKNPILLNSISLFGIKMDMKSVRSVWNISSVKENTIQKYMNTSTEDLINHHKKYLTRIYPSGKRVFSSNYDPLPSFNVGAQLIALNVQTNDQHLLTYLSKFEDNGGCGYVLKPDFYCSDTKNPKYLNDFKYIDKILGIKVISGQKLRPENEDDVKDVVDPYVVVQLRGIPFDEENNKVFKSQTIRDNGFNPIFNLECEFKICCPELSFIEFLVFDEEGKLQSDLRLGWYSIPFNCIRQGYRVIPLFNSMLNNIEFSYLFCHIQIKSVLNDEKIE